MTSRSVRADRLKTTSCVHNTALVTLFRCVRCAAVSRSLWHPEAALDAGFNAPTPASYLFTAHCYKPGLIKLYYEHHTTLHSKFYMVY